jgi:hypothetical protein
VANCWQNGPVRNAAERYDQWPFWKRYLLLAAWTALAVWLANLFSSDFYLIIGVWGFLSWVLLFVRLESRRRRGLRHSTESPD